ncbi:hypothetical protein L596_023499 [Steinernema carpocapsae]|uniref:Uncharacterized protein n=1 Tax=Steinernema carpocapsae TaxID=34508 RepID=A0A4U5MDV6_STECR|nr:hypothetical protein L596_023499 [Steinernema carpocapsae]
MERDLRLVRTILREEGGLFWKLFYLVFAYQFQLFLTTSGQNAQMFCSAEQQVFCARKTNLKFSSRCS